MDPQTQQGVAMALIALASGALGLLAGVVRDRDKLKYDAKLLALDTTNVTQAKQIAQLTVTQEACEQRHRECEEKHTATEERINRLVEMIANSGPKQHTPLKE